jgi:hypothetical protein
MVHQPHAQERFQLADRYAEGRLGDEAGSGGLAEVTVFREGREVPELPGAGQVHCLPPDRFYESLR